MHTTPLLIDIPSEQELFVEEEDEAAEDATVEVRSGPEVMAVPVPVEVGSFSEFELDGLVSDGSGSSGSGSPGSGKSVMISGNFEG